jgi:hypothetical protein
MGTDPVGEAKHLRQQVAAYRGAHFSAADHLRLFNYAVGTILIAVSAVVSGSVLQATNGNPSQRLTLVAGILAIIVTVLTSIQTTFKPGERAEHHRAAADGFGRLERRLEIFVGRAHPDLNAAWDELDKLSNDISDVEAGAPGYMGLTYRRSAKRVSSA